MDLIFLPVANPTTIAFILYGMFRKSVDTAHSGSVVLKSWP
jgi:hypothetical protein